MRRPRVLTVDDHPVVLAGLAVVLNELSVPPLICTAHDGQSALASMRETPPDLVILDLNMPQGQGPDGVALVRAARAAGPTCRILTLTVAELAWVEAPVREAGADAVLSKTDSEQLRSAAESLLGLDPSDEARSLYPERANGLGDDVTSERTLTPLELDVVRLCSRDLTLRQVAKVLGVSYQYASRARSTAMARLRVRSWVDLYRFACDHQLH